MNTKEEKVWLPEDSTWRVAQDEERLCRSMKRVFGHNFYCKRPAVAALKRRGRGGQGTWWHYCEEHLYGRRIHEGRVEYFGYPGG